MHITRQIHFLFFALLLTLFPSASHALVPSGELPIETPVEVWSVSPQQTQDADFDAAQILTVTLNMEPDWYAYGPNPGPVGKPTKLTATSADGTQLRVIYPTGIDKPDAFDPSVIVTTFAPGTRLFVLIPPDTVDPVALHLDLLLCHPTKCLPARLDLTYTPTDAPLAAADSQPWWPDFVALASQQPATASSLTTDSDDKASSFEWQFTPRYLQPGLEVGGLLTALFMGLLAGLILNVMPCVLPVVSLKLSALLNTGNEDDPGERKRAFRQHNIFFSLGVILFFLVLALALSLTGQAWGALFQNRWLVLGLAAVVGVLAFSLFGLFHLPVIDLKFGSGHANPRSQAFFTGMLTTLLATPCSGPFLGGVLGWALIQGPFIIATVFASIGVGMAIPYLLMAANPGLSKFLPKSGPWIAYVEKLIGFFLVGTAFYLVTIAMGDPTPRILAPLWVILFGGWLWMRSRQAKTIRTRWTVRVLAVVLLAIAVTWTTPGPEKDNPWTPFDPATFQTQLGKQKLFVDFTADWCPTCKVLEATVLTDDNVARWKKEYGLTFIKVDMTDRDPDAEALLAALGSRSIPTAALFPAGPESSSPLVLRDLFTKSQLENAMESWEKQPAYTKYKE